MFRVYGGMLFEEEAHYERLRKSAEGTRIELPDLADTATKLRELVKLNEVADGTVYVQVTRGEAPRNHLFPLRAAPVTMAYCTSTPRPIAAMEQGIHTVTTPDIRWLRCDLKTLNLLPNALFKQYALDHDASDVIFHRDGIVTECSASNLFIVQGGALVTHPANHLILKGVTRDVVIRIAREAGIPALERPFSLHELAQAEEAFVTGTTVEITPVISIDGRPVGSDGPGLLTRKLQQLFYQRIGNL
ncbi:aminotransferase class IV [Cohnella faecalis]|uniref:aminotransferase class IV n=1 Tax=Cohnella faecalis TaxID=2315694 RepID=UPI001F38FF50|nr:aminotransferase class IV [Cohnella faecalis]